MNTKEQKKKWKRNKISSDYTIIFPQYSPLKIHLCVYNHMSAYMAEDSTRRMRHRACTHRRMRICACCIHFLYFLNTSTDENVIKFLCYAGILNIDLHSSCSTWLRIVCPWHFASQCITYGRMKAWKSPRLARVQW